MIRIILFIRIIILKNQYENRIFRIPAEYISRIIWRLFRKKKSGMRNKKGMQEAINEPFALRAVGGGEGWLGALPIPSRSAGRDNVSPCEPGNKVKLEKLGR